MDFYEIIMLSPSNVVIVPPVYYSIIVWGNVTTLQRELINMIEYFGQVSLHIYIVLLNKAMLIIWPGVNELLYIEDRLGIL